MRRLFAAGKAGPWSRDKADVSPVILSTGTNERATVCPEGAHIGPLNDTERFDAFGNGWAGMGNCGAPGCGSTIHRSQLRAEAA